MSSSGQSKNPFSHSLSPPQSQTPTATATAISVLYGVVFSLFHTVGVEPQSWSMSVNGSFLSSRVSNLLVPDRNPCLFRPDNSATASIHRRSFGGPFPNINPSASLGAHRFYLSAPTPLLYSKHDSFLSPTLPKLLKRPHRPLPPRASKDVSQSFRFPIMTEKPKWWWRTLSCIPYLMPLHGLWVYAETAYHLHPFLEDFEFLTYPFHGAVQKLPSWFLMAYFFFTYLGVVRRKEWPHFLRFHVMIGTLLEMALQVIGMVSHWMPLAWYWGKLGMHFWTAVAFAYMFTVLECVRCALAGMYADVPFVCDAAYMQIPYD